MSVSGAPEPCFEHATNVADVALKLLQRMPNLEIPSGIIVQIRIGIEILNKFLEFGLRGPSLSRLFFT